MIKRNSGYLFVLLAAWSWGLIGILSKFLLVGGLHPLETAFWRAAFGAVLFGAHAFAVGALRIQRKADAGAFALFGIFCIAGFFAAYQYSVRHSGAAVASVLLYTAPAWVAIFSRVIFKEPITSLKVVAIATALAGAAFVSFSGGGQAEAVAPLGVLCGLLAGLAYSFHYIFSKIYLTRYSAATIYCLSMTVGAVVLLPLVPFVAKTPLDWLVAFLLGLVCSYVAYLAYCAGLRRLSPVRTVVLATLEPIFAVIMAWIVWDERFTLFGWIGAGLILAAVLLIVAERDKAEMRTGRRLGRRPLCR